MRLIPFVLIVFLSCPGMQAQPNHSDWQVKQDHSAAKEIMYEMVSAVTGGALAAVAGFSVGFLASNGSRDGSRLGMHLAYPIGAAAGATYAGRVNQKKGSFLTSLGLSSLFAGLTYISYPILPDKSQMWFYVLAGPVGAIIGNHLTRKEESDLLFGSLIHVKNGRIQSAIALPVIHRIGGQNQLELPLISVRF